MIHGIVTVNRKHLKDSMQNVSIIAHRKILAGVQKADAMMRNIEEQAKTSSMVATGELQDHTQYFGCEMENGKTQLVAGILPCTGRQELICEDVIPNKSGVHTTVEEHIKFGCSRAMVGDDPDPSVYKANPMAKKRSFFNAIRNVTGLDLSISRNGSGYRYRATGMLNLTRFFTAIKSAMVKG